MDSTVDDEPTRFIIGNQAMMGASMGGLATIYALGERPDVFVCGLVFSVHWSFGGDPLVDALVDRLPEPVVCVAGCRTAPELLMRRTHRLNAALTNV